MDRAKKTLEMEDLSIDVEKFTGLVIFSIDDWEFCVNFKEVLLILRGDEMKNVENIGEILRHDDEPSIPEINLMNFCSFFGLKERNPKANTRLLFVQGKETVAGFFVDGIKEIITVDREFVRNKLEFISIQGTDYIKGLIKFENRTFLYPDYEKIIINSLNKKTAETV